MVKKKSSRRSKIEIKQEFDEFARKIADLESLRQKLNSLDSRGFDSEVKSIRAKLKDVNAISVIRREINSLEEKIQHKKARKSVKSRVATKLLEKSKDLEEDQEVMKAKILELEDELKEKVEKPIVKRQLSRDMVDDVRDIPKLEGQLKALKKDFHEHSRVGGVSIDPDVDVVVDTNFEDLITNIKGELSERVHSKEQSLDSELKADLEARNSDFAKRYENLVRKFNEKYEKAVKNELKREVQKRFEIELSKKLEEERKQLIVSLVKENVQRLHLDRRQMISDLEEGYEKKENDLIKRLNKKEVEGMNKIKEKKDVLVRNKHIVEIKSMRIEEKEIELGKRDKQLRDGLGGLHRKENSVSADSSKLKDKLSEARAVIVRDREKLEKELVMLNKKEEAFVKSHQNKSRLELKKHDLENSKKFDLEVQRIKKEMHDELIMKVCDIKKSVKVDKGLKKKKRVIKKNLKKKYSGVHKKIVKVWKISKKKIVKKKLKKKSK